MTALADPAVLVTTSAAINSIAAAYDAIDSAGRGYVTPDSLRAGLARLGPALSDAQLSELMAHVDSDGDGRADRIDWTDSLSPTNPAARPFLFGPARAALLRGAGAARTEDDVAALDEAGARVSRVSELAGKLRVTLMVDAEQVRRAARAGIRAGPGLLPTRPTPAPTA